LTTYNLMAEKQIRSMVDITSALSQYSLHFYALRCASAVKKM